VFVIFCVKLSGFHGGRLKNCSDVSDECASSKIRVSDLHVSHLRRLSSIIIKLFLFYSNENTNIIFFYAMCETQNAARFVELITTALKINLFWDVALCLWVRRSGRFEGSYLLRNGGNCLPNDRAHYSRRLQHPARKTIILAYLLYRAPKRTFLLLSFGMFLQSATISWT
jgi:hypothetical protein